MEHPVFMKTQSLVQHELVNNPSYAPGLRLKDYIRTACNYSTAAQAHWDAGNTENALVNFMRTMTLATERIFPHRDYSSMKEELRVAFSTNIKKIQASIQTILRNTPPHPSSSRQHKTPSQQQQQQKSLSIQTPYYYPSPSSDVTSPSNSGSPHDADEGEADHHLHSLRRRVDESWAAEEQARNIDLDARRVHSRLLSRPHTSTQARSYSSPTSREDAITSTALPRHGELRLTPIPVSSTYHLPPVSTRPPTPIPAVPTIKVTSVSVSQNERPVYHRSQTAVPRGGVYTPHPQPRATLFAPRPIRGGREMAAGLPGWLSE